MIAGDVSEIRELRLIRVETEFGCAPLGDERLSQRLVGIAADKAGQPDNAHIVALQKETGQKSAHRMDIARQKEAARAQQIGAIVKSRIADEHTLVHPR